MKFEVGDKVRVREDLVEGNFYGVGSFVDSMKYCKGKVFEITDVMGRTYILGGNGFRWTDEMLEEVKEVQEKTFREVIADIKEGETWESAYVTIWVDSEGTHIKGMSSNTCISNSIKFKKLKRKEYTFAEAFKAYEEGKEIESCHSQYKFKRDGEKDLFFDKEYSGVWCDAACFFDMTEIRGKWYINN